MSKAYLDTTILADVLLGSSEAKARSLAALKRFDSAETPVYAIKELKAGPIYNWVWLHNTLKKTGSHAKTLKAIQGMMCYKRNLPATALGALAECARATRATFGELAERYGKKADSDAVAADRLRLEARRRITMAWRKRRTLATVVVPLECYTEHEPHEGRDGLLTCLPVKCDDRVGCALQPILKAKPHDLSALRKVVLEEPRKPENSRRAQALKELVRNRPLTDQMCRSLGDVVFAFLAPSDSVILTTNEKDHRPLADALGKKVEKP